jgi:hypothetical protein
MKKWQYNYEFFLDVDDLTMRKLNKLGKEGWELIGFTSVGTAVEGSSRNIYRMIFKRPLK